MCYQGSGLLVSFPAHVNHFLFLSYAILRPWDVCAGIVIAQEAGCVVTGGHIASKGDHAFDVGEEILTGRKYVVIRAIGDTQVGSASF